jgi:uncharacterized membrane protein YsdA (DUF1294 family)/cold shock CspA family protein
MEGTLVYWNDDKGFGFVRPLAGGDDYFVHISVFDKRLSRRPEIADRIFYQADQETPERKKRLAYATIKGVEAETETKKTLKALLNRPRPPYLNFVVTLPLLFSLILIGLAHNPLPLISYVFLSVLAIVLYGLDKRHAITGEWRIPESYMHVLEVMGGWPGVLLASNDFSHKIRKGSYRTRLWAIIILHGLGWLALWIVLYFRWSSDWATK